MSDMDMKSSDVHIVIMAGGVGSRFWPMSTEDMPKQFLDILGTGKSLLQQTFDRFTEDYPVQNIHVLTNDRYKSLVSEQLPSIPDVNIICEPARRNTAPCLVYAALRIQQINTDAVMVVTPADHMVVDEVGFRNNISQGVDEAKASNSIVTLGIKPSRPDTGYGYIEFEGEEVVDTVRNVKQFREKPALAQAQEFLDSGSFYWNAGIFIWTTKRMLSDASMHMADILNPLADVAAIPDHDKQVETLNTVYPTLRNESIDFGLMEHADRIMVVLTSFGWSDLGTWGSVYQELDKDADGNATLGNTVVLEEVSHCMIYNDCSAPAIIRGIKDQVVINTASGLLLYPLQSEQELKKSLQKL